MSPDETELFEAIDELLHTSVKTVEEALQAAEDFCNSRADQEYITIGVFQTEE